MRHKLPTLYLIGAIGLCALALLPQGGATPGTPAPNTYTGPVFEDVSQRSGLTVPNVSSPDKRYVIESMSGGVGLFDCDNDGKLDIVTINSSTVERYRDGGDPMVTLYHQEPDGTFKDITKQAGLARRGWGMGVAVADFDNDGWLDLYVTGYGGNVLYRNLGGCKFEDVTEKAGVRGGGFSTGAAWADYDRDGHVDLFVARYVHVDINNLPEFGRDKFCRYRGVLVQCGPWGLPGESDLLYHNRGDGTFEEVAEKAGVDDKEKRYGLGVVWGDYDNDGWPDLFVANDAGSNYLYHNNQNGTFKDVALLSGVALSGTGMPQGNMGVDFGDYNHDGWFDIIDTTFADQPKTLYRSLGPAGFEDVSSMAQIAQVSLRDVAWGTGFVDFDNDGWPDIFIANGHVYPQVDAATTGGARYKEPIFLHLNKHDGTFEEISSASGLASLPLVSRRGVAFGDIWNDGAMDILILNVGEPPTLLRNHLANGNHWVEFKLRGTKSNRAAIGSRLTIHSGELSQFNEVRGGSSYLSQNDIRLHFGLGRNAKIDSVDISWPSGFAEHLGNLAADRIYTIEEGKGIIPTSPTPTTGPEHPSSPWRK
jgi:enediyne biosynthesis protein E4